MRRSAAQTRARVLEVAHELFYWHGIRAVGVDRIAAEAGIAPTTLYRLFAAKDDLVAAYMERADSLYRQWFDEVTRDDGRCAADRIRALFAAQTDQVQPQQCRGCPFLMVLAEIPDASHPAHRHAVATKTWVRQRLGELTDEMGVADPLELTDRIVLVLEGVYASVQALGAHGPARQAQALADLLLTTARG